MQFSPVCCCLLPLSTTYFPQHRSGTPPVCAPPSNVTNQVSKPNKTTGRIIVVYMILDSEHTFKYSYLNRSGHSRNLSFSQCLCDSTTDMLLFYLYFETFLNDPLCHAFYLLKKIIQLVPLAVASGRNSLLVCNEAPVFSLVLG